MNEIERLKKAEEAKQMGILVIPWPKNGCRGCDLCLGIDDKREMSLCGYENIFRFMHDGIYQFCSLRPAIGIIEPNGRVRYFREDET